MSCISKQTQGFLVLTLAVMSRQRLLSVGCKALKTVLYAAQFCIGRACGVSRAVIAASITTNEASDLMVRLCIIMRPVFVLLWAVANANIEEFAQTQIRALKDKVERLMI